MSLISENPDN